MGCAVAEVSYCLPYCAGGFPLVLQFTVVGLRDAAFTGRVLHRKGEEISHLKGEHIAAFHLRMGFEGPWSLLPHPFQAE